MHGSSSTMTRTLLYDTERMRVLTADEDTLSESFAMPVRLTGRKVPRSEP